MKLYYTTTSGLDQVQNKKTNSLGGYKSSTSTPNSRENNLFGEISMYTISNNKPEYIGLFLKNETGVDIQNIEIYFVYRDDCYSKYEISAVELSQDSEGVNIMEHVDDRYSAPYNADFYEADGQTNAVNIGSLSNSSEIGLWLKRTLTINDIKSFWENRITDQGDEVIEADIKKKDIIDIVISWDLV